MHVPVAHTFSTGYDASTTCIVDHIDGNKEHNAAKNLRFVTAAKNTTFAIGLKIKATIKHSSGKEEIIHFDSFVNLNKVIAFNSLKNRTLRELRDGQFKGQALYNEEEVYVIIAKRSET